MNDFLIRNYFYRDICKSNGRDYAEELIPFISILLQSVVLHPKSLCLIIESLNACVESKAIDARAGKGKMLIIDNYSQLLRHK